MIKNQLTCTYKFPAAIKDRATLEQAILDHLSDARYGAYPLKQITLRFSASARRIKLKLQDVLQNLSDDGKIGIRFFPTLNRTFVFDGPYWFSCMDDYVNHAQDDVFDLLEQGVFKDMK